MRKIKINKWEDKKENTGNLYLDLKNPRIPEYARTDETSIITYLLENDDVMDIATNIAQNGYHSSAVSIVCLEKNRLVVLDGNRRLAACKLLLNPQLAHKDSYRKKLQSLKTVLKQDQIVKIKITIAPSRDMAEKEIWDIHMNPLMRPWQTIQKLRKYQSLIKEKSQTLDFISNEYGVSKSKMQKDLIKLAFYEKILPMLDTEKDKEKLLRTGFNKIEKIIAPAHGKRFLGYVIDEDTGEIEVLDKKKFDANLEKITPYILNNNAIKGYALGAQCIAGEIEEVFNFLDKSYKKTSLPVPTASPLGGQVVAKNNKTTLKIQGTCLERDWITESLYKKYDVSTGSIRVKKILQEMKSSLFPKGYENISAVSLRVLLELSLFSFLEKKGYIKEIIKKKKESLEDSNKKRIKKDPKARTEKLKNNWSPDFREMLSFTIDEKNGVITNPQKRKAIDKLLKDKKLSEFIDDLNQFIHNPDYIPTFDIITDTWKRFGRVIFEIII